MFHWVFVQLSHDFPHLEAEFGILRHQGLGVFVSIGIAESGLAGVIEGIALRGNITSPGRAVVVDNGKDRELVVIANQQAQARKSVFQDPDADAS